MRDMHPIMRSTVGQGLLGLFLVGLASGSLACSKKSAAASSAGVASTTGASVPLPHIDIPLPPAAPALGGRLQGEAAHRVAGTPTAEQMFGTLQVKGVALHDVRQYVAATWGARFCGGASTDKNLFLMVCEFDDARAAVEGKGVTEKMFTGPPAGPPRPVYINKSSFLMFRDDAKTPETAEQMKTLAAIFATL
jgi:hypothetical protein